MASPRPAASTILLYSATGNAKTSQASHLARYIWKKYKKRTLFVSCDGGGFGPVQKAIDTGLIEPWNIPILKEGTLIVLRKLSQGWWPKVDGNGKLTLTPPTPDRWEEFGAVVVEGVTSWGDRLMRDLRMNNRKVGQEANFSFDVTAADLGITEKETFAGASPAYYGFIQNELQNLIENYRSVPVEKILWTALEGKGEEKTTKESQYGPDIAGNKAVPKCPAWFGDALHLDDYRVVKKDAKNVDVVDPKTGAKIETKFIRAYFQDHPDPRTGIRWPAKARVAPEDMPKLLEKYPGGYFDLTYETGIEEFLEYEDKLLEDSVAIREKIGFDPEKFKTDLAARIKAAQPQSSVPTVPTGTTTPQKK